MKITLFLFAAAFSSPLTAKLEGPKKDETKLKVTPKGKDLSHKRPAIKRLFYKPTNTGRVEQYKQIMRQQKMRTNHLANKAHENEQQTS